MSDTHTPTPTEGGLQKVFGAHGEPSAEVEAEDDQRQLMEAVFGPRPQGGSRADRLDKLIWDGAVEEFDALLETNLEGQTIGMFVLYGLGLPMRWRGRFDREHLAFPDAKPARLYRMSVNTAETAPHLMITGAQSQAIANGLYVEKLHPILQETVWKERNEANKP